MASETTTTTADDLSYAAIIEEAVLEELRATNVMAKLMRQKSLEGKASKAVDFPKWPTATAATVSEATDLSNTAISTTKATITAGEVGLMATVTDVLEKSDILDGLSEYSGVLGRAVSTKIDVDCAALLASTNSSTAVGTSGANLTEAQWLDGLTVCENAGAHKVGRIVCVLHTQQVGDLRAALSTATGVIRTDIAGKRELYSNTNGFFGELHNVDIFSDANVPTANTAADRAGGFFVAGYTFGLATKWALRVELQRDASLRATEIVTTANYGVGEIVDAAGCPVVTDA